RHVLAAHPRALPPRRASDLMPQPTNGAEISLVTARGFPEEAITLEGLFQYRGEMLDPIADAKTAPGSFSPLCGFTGELVLRGAGDRKSTRLNSSHVKSSYAV